MAKVPTGKKLKADDKVISPQAGKVHQEPTVPKTFPMPECVPFPPSSDFAKIFAILYNYKDKGISKPDLVDCYRLWSLKTFTQADRDVNGFLEDGSDPKGISEVAGYIWIVDKNGLITLHFVRQSPKATVKSSPSSH